MKKILIIILCLPLLFSSCKKEDDISGNNNDNGNFLENQDGSVWNLLASDIELHKIGFYDANSFMVWHLEDTCAILQDGMVDGNMILSISEHTDVKLKTSWAYDSDPTFIYYEYIFTIGSPQSNSMNLQAYVLDMNTLNMVLEYSGDFVRSTNENNLFCP